MVMKNSGKDSKLRVTYKKRKDGMKKKAGELSVLCGIDACVMIIGPDGDTDCWPGNTNNIRSIIQRYKDCKTSNNAAATNEISDGRVCVSKEVRESFLCDVEKKLKEVNDRIGVVNFMNGGSQNNVATGQPSFTDMLNYGYLIPMEMFGWQLGQYQSFGNHALMWPNNVDNGVGSSSTVMLKDGYLPVPESREKMFDLGLSQYQSFGDHAQMWQNNNDNGAGSSSNIVTMNGGYVPIMENTEEMGDRGLDQYQSFGEDASVCYTKDFMGLDLQL